MLTEWRSREWRPPGQTEPGRDFGRSPARDPREQRGARRCCDGGRCPTTRGL